MNLLQRIRFAYLATIHRRSLAAQRRAQMAQLRRLLRHAYAHIPLTRHLFDERGVTPERVQSLAMLPMLPATSKQTFLGRVPEEYIDSSRAINSRWYVTSGTSGVPFRFLMSEIAIDDSYADFASFRFLWWRGEAMSRLPEIRIARIKIRAFSGPNRLFISVEDYIRDPAACIERLVAFNTEILYAYPSILFDMARRVLRDPTLPRVPLRFALSFGEMLTPAVRRFVEAALSCEVYDRYGLEEIGVIGVECARHDGFHINTESVIVEVTDDSYQPVAPGVHGRILATDLYNFGMPFIRYDTGDRGVISNDPCACGLRSPRIWITGRYSAYLTFTGRRIHHLEFDGAMDGFMNDIFQYQVVKTSDTALTVRVIPGPSFRPEVAERVAERLRALVGDTVAVRVEVTDVIAPTPRGKSRIVLDEAPH